MKINVSRFIKMQKADFCVEVLTPMFLGGASGNAELRAAPFKNAIRYWWRITRGDIPHDELRDKEQELFGGVTGKANRSLVDVVVTGDVKTGEADQKDNIGEKQNTEANNRRVALSAYLGMGPVHFNGKYTKRRILPSEKFKLSVSFPEDHSKRIIDTLSLFSAFGALGARSRNGWGSFDLQLKKGEISLLTARDLFLKFGEEISTIFNSETGKFYLV